MNIFTLRSTLTARYVAAVALCAMILSAFPASFFVAFAEEDLISSTNTTIDVATPKHESIVVDVSEYEALQLSFSYNAEALDNGDKFVYGWRSAGSDNQLGSVNGKNETGNNAPTDETNSVNVALPESAQVTDLQLYFEMEGNKADDDAVIISGYKMSGNKVVIDLPLEDETENTNGDILEDSNNGGNTTCEAEGYGQYLSSDRIDGDDLLSPGSYTFTGGSITWTHNDTYLDWQATGALVHAVIVKGSNDNNLYEYNPATTSDTGLFAPEKKDISNLTFCYEIVETEEPEDPVEFCSFAGLVIETTVDAEAKQNNGSPVAANRRDVAGVENGPATYINTSGKEPTWSTDDFFSLGIGGYLIYEFTGQVAHPDGSADPDIAIYEITGGTSGQSDEEIEVLVSQDGVSYSSLGDYTGDAYVDIDPAGLAYVKYVKLIDKSQGVQGASGDGYDVDAIVILNDNCGREPKVTECTLTMVSDELDLVVEKNDYAKELSQPYHPSWLTEITGSLATWIWGDDPVEEPTTVDETQTFKKSFTWTGDSVTSATLTLASDNSHAITLGTFTDGDAGEVNYVGTTEYDVTSAIVAGTNTLEVAVKNFALANSDATSNPAGLIYELTIEGATTGKGCGEVVPLEPVDPTPKTATVTMCKVDQMERPLAGWTLMLLDEQVDTLVVPANTPAGVDTASLLASTSYVAIAEGTWDNNRGPLNIVDAEYSTEDNWATQMDGFTGFPTDILELFVNDVSDPASQWGTYNSNHRYAQSFVPASDGTINVHINDTFYGDNTGSLDVEIYTGFAGITDDSGCVVFTDVPYGTYTADEVMLDGWENVSGLGGVVVDAATVVHTIVNDNGDEPALVCEPQKNLITNGGFEAPVVNTPQNWNLFASGAALLEWVVEWVNPVGAPEVASLEVHNGLNGWVSAAGDQHAELDSDFFGPGVGSGGTASTKISQTIPTIDGEVYTLGWSYSARPGTAAADNEMEVLVDNVLLTTVGPVAGVANTAWTAGTTTFVGTGAPMEVTFMDVGPANSLGSFIDDVTLYCGRETDDSSNDDESNGDNDDSSTNTDPTFRPSGGGGVITGTRTSSGSDDEELGDVAGTEFIGSGGDFPVPAVLGEQVSIVPSGAPNAGAGGADTRTAMQPIALLLMMIVLLALVRKEQLV